MLIKIIASVILGMLIFYAVLLWRDVRKLNKLRRQYAESEETRGKFSVGIGAGSPVTQIGSAGFGNPEIERAFEQIRTGRTDSKSAVIQPSSMDRSSETERRTESNHGFSGRKFRRI